MEFLTRVSIHRHAKLHCQVVECIAPTVNQIRDRAIIIKRGGGGGGAEKLELSSKNLDSTAPQKQKN